MRAAAIAMAMFLLQGVYDRANEVDAAPERFRLQRTLQPPAGAQGQACAVLDATLYAHTEGRLTALRIYSSGHEVPFAITESGELGQQAEPARVMNLGRQGKTIVFDLAMPQRAYTEVVLDLDGRDFYATAKVSGEQQPGGARTDLGEFVLFDLRSDGLSRSTTLALQESSFPILHVEMAVTSAPGGDPNFFELDMVRGASVPPSREAQTLYTTVAETTVFEQHGKSTVATLQVPAHVPIERAHIVLDPAFHRDFLRSVTVAGKTNIPDAIGADESVAGEIERVERPPSPAGIPAIRSEQLNVDALLASNLRKPATITLTVNNGDDAALPLRAVDLQMRQREVCFDAEPGAAYVLRYGDPTPVRPPVYDYAQLFRANPNAAVVALGPETPNPQFRDDTPPPQSYPKRHPELLWVALLLVIGVLGTVALHNARRVGRQNK
jgi:hypothetical protein